MNTEAIEEVALHLPIEQRAQLAHRLLLTLDDFSEAEITEAWREESQHRAADLNQGISSPVSSDEVSALAKSLLK
jgi:putative addiction module component (TIGR02574 family)